MTIFKTAAAAVAISLLAACGGGGGSAGMSENPPAPSGPVPDTVVLGDVLITAQGTLARGNASCSGTVCTVSFLSESEMFDLRDVVDPIVSCVSNCFYT